MLDIFCAFVSSIGHLSNVPSKFFLVLRKNIQYYFRNIIDFVFPKQFEANSCNIYLMLKLH